MKIFFLIGTLKNGGQERQLVSLISQLRNDKRLKIGVIVWTFTEDQKYVQNLNDMSIPIYGIKDKSYLNRVKSLQSILRKHKPDVVQSFTLRLNLPAWLTTRFISTVAIGGLRSGFWSGFGSEPKALRFLSGMLPVKKISNNHKGADELRRLYRRFGLRKQNVQVVANRMDTKVKLDWDAKRNAIHNKPVRLVSMSSLSYVKQVDQIMRLCAELKSRGLSFHHFHAGNGYLLEELQALLIELAIEDCFTFVGEVSDLAEFYSKAYLLIHFARSEGSPNVHMEASCYGTPVVSSDCGDASRIITNDETGFITSDFDIMVNKVEELINNPDKVESMSRLAAERATKKFDVKDFPEDLFSAYNKLGILSQKLTL